MAVLLLVTTLVAAATAFTGFLGLAGKLPPNHFAGIRTSSTLRSPQNWYAAHRAAGPYLVLFSVAALSAGLAFVPFAIAGKLADPLLTTIAVAQVALIVAGALLWWRAGTSKAKAQPGEPAK